MATRQSLISLDDLICSLVFQERDQFGVVHVWSEKDGQGGRNYWAIVQERFLHDDRGLFNSYIHLYDSPDAAQRKLEASAPRIDFTSQGVTRKFTIEAQLFFLVSKTK